MLFSGTFVILAALVEFLVRAPRAISWPLFTLGCAISLCSFALRAWSAHALGRLWSMHIEMRGHEHELVRTGPYAWVRHPIYTAAALELIGAVLMLEAWFSGLGILLVFAPAIYWRIRLEESAMITNFGAAYRAYIDSTPALVPYKIPGK